MSDIARKLIEENKKTKMAFLDLGNCGLTEIPKEIGELVWLESLSLASNWSEWYGESLEFKESQNAGANNHNLHDLGPLAGLKNLGSLFIRGMQVTDLAPLAGLRLQTLDVERTQVSDLAPLTSLTELQRLNVSSTQVTDLAPLASLTGLQELYVSSTQVTDLAPLAGLTELQRLNVSSPQVSDLAPLAGLTELQYLSVGQQVTDLAPLAGLTELQDLNVSSPQVSDLAPLAGLTRLRNLDVGQTQVTDLSPLRSMISSGCPVVWSGSIFYVGIQVEGCPLTNRPKSRVAVIRGNISVF